MSQISFTTTYQGHPAQVVAGWDRPLQHFFLTVFDLRPDAPQETFWDNLIPSPEDAASTDRLRFQLDTMGIAAPEDFWRRVELREGNAVHAFKDGVWSNS